ncbi:hypothetical protein JEZ13_11455 [bacterium]|nr:hypothetical protein [bacterium]
MNEQKKKIIYFIIIALIAVAFIVLYMMDTSIKKSDDSFFTDIFNISESPIPNDSSSVIASKNSSSLDNSAISQSYHELDEIKVIDWNEVDVDSIYVDSNRNKFTLTRHGFKKWAIKSVRIDEKIPSSNNAIFRLLNVFQHFFTDNNLTRNYSEMSIYFEKPICTVKTYFKDGTVGTLTFTRIEEYDRFHKENRLKTWVRVNDQTVVYATSFNILERFIVSETEFLKFR